MALSRSTPQVCPLSMTEIPVNSNQPSDNEQALETEQSSETSESLQPLLDSLRRKEGNWVKWGQACQQLQKAGYKPQVIFEETGFEPIHQNQIIVAAQVYQNLEQKPVPESVRSHFEERRSDILYEFRILNQDERCAAAALTQTKNLNLDEARELAKAMKEFSRLPSPPEAFTNHPGDAVAYQCWKLANKQADLQDRSRLIARGLAFAQSPTARQKIEALLTEFAAKPARPAPRLPVFRLESEDELPRIVPVVGKLPLAASDLKAAPMLDETEPFNVVQFSGGQGAWVAIPGWQVILQAEDPVAILCDREQLPAPLPGQDDRDVLSIVDRAQRQWDVDNYYLVEQDGQLQFQWFEDAPTTALLGRLLLILRPKRILDENITKDPWQVDE